MMIDNVGYKLRTKPCIVIKLCQRAEWTVMMIIQRGEQTLNTSHMNCVISSSKSRDSHFDVYVKDFRKKVKEFQNLINVVFEGPLICSGRL